MRDTSDIIIYVGLFVATVFGVLSFFYVPLYEKGAWAVIGLAVLIVTNVMSFKFGIHMPKTDSPNSTLTVKNTTDPDPADKV